MRTRKIAGFDVSVIGLGCMNLSYGYGPGPDEAYGVRLLNEALDAGYTFMDTAALYGFGANEKLVGKAIGHRRDDYVLASKCGLRRNNEGVREINGRPDVIRETCEQSLSRLGVDVIDLYYLHRMDPNVPIEDSVGALSDLVREGKIREVGLSEVSADTIRRAHKVHPIAAVQSEYSLWTRNPEIAVLDACEDIGAAFVAFSPVARKFLTGTLQDVSGLHDDDIRKTIPRFDPENYEKNLELLEEYANLAEETGCSMAQLALAWLLAKGDTIIPIPGTTSIEHMLENAAAADVSVSFDVMTCLESLINQNTVIGARYDAKAQKSVGTEEFPS
ncbi:aldo/keto reductase [Sneathiella chinensis]|uniref:Aldo/keto reductase n=1 Tax=Sneathiella chinensis TaxID=349750 RepID=A0ABQ5U452_9PROT|nr:aldo/keto reductase [Sneathiella chinensis]GLQ06102.1 aldo/keto reductase [Sneathiella chinensis]